MREEDYMSAIDHNIATEVAYLLGKIFNNDDDRIIKAKALVTSFAVDISRRYEIDENPELLEGKE